MGLGSLFAGALSGSTKFLTDATALFDTHPIHTACLGLLAVLSLIVGLQMLVGLISHAILSVVPVSWLAGKTSSLALTAVASIDRDGTGKSTSRPWAVVTGASDGIGKEFVLQLAHLGYNIVLISRSETKLQAVVDTLQKKKATAATKTVVLPVDYTTAGDEQYLAVKAVLSPLHIAVLVNNVATNHAFPVAFNDETPDMIDNIVQVNIVAQLRMTRLVLPQMIARKAGTIINIGSMAGKVPSAYLSVYSASKAFLRFWSQALALEVQPSGVHVEHINTYFVATAMSKIRKTTWLAPTPKAYVQAVIANVGSSTNSTPYPSHSLLNWIIDRFVPESIMMQASAEMHLDIRKRALAKQARDAKKQ
ncbi:hypothetical protein BASA50_010640 [Batrachochytrium salamandrivorans]|uniref:Very-long-chain 3-oxoacyl-CoA reductase n=1 Tax=Batrachochytrium salamandrivorans TaxID=1357716 RepID=A0ABQ8EXY4_9FUNG|nr:hypothetical protein BASA62_004320 [Batrachochytrium salamandrivorans]KAH6576182.1 hypothetical protein BASA60_004650 [Batrachochytrium salamandrivorans]KAH6588570.1 hypothetical protein BASA50_010640 [Batrachochytrium salamandrivorans]KAH6588855.1 hypothetical protein BASA61_005808 [Batrachochytrium salamandrivorans]KAH9251612.1 hypothetical protein BASA81_010521 [Batrachochytrium salamandrivorans]